MLDPLRTMSAVLPKADIALHQIVIARPTYRANYYTFVVDFDINA
jgi:hypothetical protein